MPNDRSPATGDGRASETAAIARLVRLGGETLARELAALFLEDMPGRVAVATRALRAGDAAGVIAAAHKMRSASAQLGAEALARACHELEASAERDDLESAARSLSGVVDEYEAFGDWLTTRTRQFRPARPHDGARDRVIGSSDSPPSIAVIEDNADNRLLVDAILGDRFVLHEYATGADALAGMTDRRPDLVLLDVSLPGMDGLEVVARLRADPAWAMIPVVALTAHAMSGDRERYLAAGFDDYVAKPIVDERDLIDAVERLLPRRDGATPSRP